MFRHSRSRAHALVWNLLLLLPFLIAELLALAWIVSDISDAWTWCGLALCAVPWALCSNDILAPSLWLIVLSVWVTLSSNRTLWYALAFFAIIEFLLSSTFMLILEIVAAAPILWPLCRGAQSVYGRTIGACFPSIANVEVLTHSVPIKCPTENTPHQHSGLAASMAEPPTYSSCHGITSIDYPGNVLLRRIQKRKETANICLRLIMFVIKVFSLLREVLLIPLVLVPFVVDPYFTRFVDKCSRGEDSHYYVFLHGSGANTGQWLVGRFLLTIRGKAERTLFANYLNGLLHISPAGGVNELAGRILQQLDAEMSEILAFQESVDLSLVGHSLGGDLIVECLHRLYFSSKHGSQTNAARIQAVSSVSTGTDSTTPPYPALQDKKVAIRNVVAISGPFRGSHVLEVLVSSLPHCISSLIGFNAQPNFDFMPGSSKCRELSSYVHKDLLLARMPWNISLVCGGTDWIVEPRSALCACTNDVHDSEQDANDDELNSGRQDAFGRSRASRHFVYIESTGHYSIVAVNNFWQKVYDLVTE